VHVLRKGNGVLVREACSAEERAHRRAKLAAIILRLGEVVPEAKLTDDVKMRRSDVTWDIGENEQLSSGTVDRLAAEIQRGGARTTRSSVHIHATFDTDDKASGAMQFLAEVFAEDVGRAVHRYAFIGDSGNDASCFSAFHTTFGVANVRSALRRLSVPPRFVASLPMGAGFAEVAAKLLALHR
jgi:hydroxymethylpyrimidine pyrophosphatase-like HAD family hydrolase